MFTNTLDNKNKIVDNKGNEIVDLTTSIFSRRGDGVDTYNTVKLNEHYLMRPDKVSFAEYGIIENTEFILKFSGISNPFSLADDDILIIPDEEQAKNQLAEVEKPQNLQSQVLTYYKFTNTDFKSDSTPYDNLAKKAIPSGVLDPDENVGFSVPYISDDGATAITFRNGRMYFGEDSGPSTAEDYAEELKNALDLKCAINGMSMTDFVRASVINNMNNK